MKTDVEEINIDANASWNPCSLVSVKDEESKGNKRLLRCQCEACSVVLCYLLFSELIFVAIK